MKRRSFLVALAALAASPFLATAQPAIERHGLRHFYRLSKQGTNPKRSAVYCLMPGDLFIACEPETKWTSGIKKCVGRPYLVWYDNEWTWCVPYE